MVYSYACVLDAWLVIAREVRIGGVDTADVERIDLIEKDPELWGFYHHTVSSIQNDGFKTA
ncbi:hypothetical protein CVT25_015808 [Psilocybe cyanescens]|uniref:Uncharacterized protein n=1 Tax=Psilocybe cyanescens TaxID=93625 RepID=A0A409X1F2_PSICY|nr:hypothetical protein CVT25_015808 [Psilocybe cyanescens]